MAIVHQVFLVEINVGYVQKLAGKIENSYQKQVQGAFRSTIQPHLWYIYLLKAQWGVS